MSEELTKHMKTLLTRAIDEHRHGNVAQAEAGYQKVLDEHPEQPDALQMMGVIALQKGEHGTAVQKICRSLAIKPEQPTAWNNLGNVYVAMGKAKMAVENYRQAIKLVPNYADAHRNLANVLRAGGLVDDAEQHYRQAIAIQPKDLASRICLAAILEKKGQDDAAIEEYRQASVRDPNSTVVLSRWGRLLRRLDRLDQARAIQKKWLQLEPNNAAAKHLYAACCPDNTPARAADAYIISTFDRIAEHYDQSRASTDYRVPQLVEAALKEQIAASRYGTLGVVDLGCGTGLCAPHLRKYAQHLQGVDLSTGMLAKATERQIYDELIGAELTEFLTRRAAHRDLIVCVDTLAYVGDLQPFFSGAASALRDAGLLLLTIEPLLRQTPENANGTASESSTRSDYQLLPDGRFGHQEDYVKNALTAAGFEIRGWSKDTFRVQDGQPVVGLIVVAEKQQPDQS